MGWFVKSRFFDRKPRMKVGRFVPPREAEPASLERLIEEGMLIVESALRMTLRNAIIVTALRDRDDLDREALQALALERIEELAEGERANAQRDSEEPGAAARRREEVRRGLAVELEQLALDEERIEAIVERSRREAWEEIADPLADRARAAVDAEIALDREMDPQDRAERVAAFLALDLAALAGEKGVELGA